jgi:hypothetical protein
MIDCNNDCYNKLYTMNFIPVKSDLPIAPQYVSLTKYDISVIITIYRILSRSKLLTSTLFALSTGLRPINGQGSDGHPRTSGKGPLPSALPSISFLFHSTVKPRSFNNSITRSKASIGTRTKRASEGTSEPRSSPNSSSACISCRA